MASSNPQSAGGSAPPKPWERAGASSGPAPFRPPSAGNTSDVVEASGTANPGELVSATGNTAANGDVNSISRPVPTRPWQQNYGSGYGGGGYGTGLNYNNGYGTGMYNSMNSYGGIGGTYGGGMYGNNMYRSGYGGGLYGGSGMYGGGMYNGGMGGPMYGGMGMGGPYQDPNNPFNGPPPPPSFWASFLQGMQGFVNAIGQITFLTEQSTQSFNMVMSFLLQFFDRAGMLYGVLARFVLKLLFGRRAKSRQFPPQIGPAGLPAPRGAPGGQKFIEGPKTAPSGSWDNVWGDDDTRRM